MQLCARFALAVMLTGAAGPADAAFKTFRDWIGACDNLRNCSAYGFDGGGGGSSYLRLERGGLPDAPARITITADVPDGATVTLRFDDPELPGLPIAPQTGEETDGADSYRRIVVAPSSAFIASLRKAKAIVLTRNDPPGRKLTSEERVSSISLSGAVAALLWIDEQQKRLETQTALIRTGPKPASAVPPQPKAAVIVAAAPFAGTAPDPSADLVARARKACDNDDNVQVEQADRLGPDLFLYYVFCPGISGAYNLNGVYFIVPAGQPEAGRLVDFSNPARAGDATPDPDSGVIATNSSFDPKTMTLHTFNKGRGIGDCGSQAIWVFDGEAFRLAEEREMPDCRGVLPDDWPVAYRALVKR